MTEWPKWFEGWEDSVGKGWLPLLNELCWKLDPLVKQHDLANERPFKVAQVKEKFGGLRFYIDGGTKEINALVAEAENKSYDVCEECGAPGKQRGGGWIKTLCDQHA